MAMRNMVLAGCAAVALLYGGVAQARTILFVGNSFTQGSHSPVRTYRPDLLTDLNGTGIGGVPALFKTFADEAGLDFTVSLETEGGKGFEFHYATKRQLIDRAWDVVVLQGLSTLDRKNPGDPTTHVENAALLAAMFKHANPAAEIDLVSTWSRADLTYLSTGHWHGRPITAMADDLAAASRLALQRSLDINQAAPVGAAWNRAFADKVADPNPYDGTTFGQVDLWTYDQYHASAAGYYLEALVLFGKFSGVDPTTLGAHEKAADALGLSPELTAALQRVARETLASRS
jgi:hypothetical protein